MSKAQKSKSWPVQIWSKRCRQTHRRLSVEFCLRFNINYLIYIFYIGVILRTASFGFACTRCTEIPHSFIASKQLCSRQFCNDISIYLSTFVCRFSPLQTAAAARQAAAAWRSVSYGQRWAVYVIYFPAHYAGVTKCLPIIIYPPLWRYIADISVWDVAAPAKKKTTDLSIFHLPDLAVGDAGIAVDGTLVRVTYM